MANLSIFRFTMLERYPVFCDTGNNKRSKEPLPQIAQAGLMFRLLCIAGAVIILACGSAVANDPPPFKDFSAKRVKPPAPGAQRRITVQIDPEEAARAAAPAPDVVEADDAPGYAARYDWFWSDVPDDLGAAAAGRLEPALSALARAKAPVAAPRLQQMQGVAQAHGVDILRATIGTQVSPALVLAVMMVESSGRADAVSGAGAQGLMQLMPDTASRFGVRDSFAASENIMGGVKYLDWLMGEFNRDPILVLAGYNAGEGAVRKHSGVPPFAETRDYVPKVLAAFQVARGLCVTPPQLASDGCVFAALN